MAGVQLSPIDESNRIAYSPVIVAIASKEIVDGHNGIFLPTFIGFTTDYIAELVHKKLHKFNALRRPERIHNKTSTM